MQDDTYLIAAEGWLKRGAASRESYRVKGQEQQAHLAGATRLPEMANGASSRISFPRRFWLPTTTLPNALPSKRSTSGSPCTGTSSSVKCARRTAERTGCWPTGDRGRRATSRRSPSRAVKARLKESRPAIRSTSTNALHARQGMANLLAAPVERQGEAQSSAGGLWTRRFDAKYPRLTEAEDQDAGSGREVDGASVKPPYRGEIERISRTQSTRRICQLAERYIGAAARSSLTQVAETLSARVDEHLKTIGVTQWS